MIQEVAKAHSEEVVGYFFNLESKSELKKNIGLNSMDKELK